MLLDHPIYHKHQPVNCKVLLMDYITTLKEQGHVELPLTGTKQANNLNDNIMRLTIAEMRDVFTLIPASHRRTLCFVLLQSLDYDSAMTYIDTALFKAHRDGLLEIYKKHHKANLADREALAKARVAHAQEMEKQCHKKLGKMSKAISDLKADNRVLQARIGVLSELAQHHASVAKKMTKQVEALKAKWAALIG